MIKPPLLPCAICERQTTKRYAALHNGLCHYCVKNLDTDRVQTIIGKKHDPSPAPFRLFLGCPLCERREEIDPSCKKCFGTGYEPVGVGRELFDFLKTYLPILIRQNSHLF
jgi:hypothetical protein